MYLCGTITTDSNVVGGRVCDLNNLNMLMQSASKSEFKVPTNEETLNMSGLRKLSVRR